MNKLLCFLGIHSYQFHAIQLTKTKMRRPCCKNCGEIKTWKSYSKNKLF